MAALDRTFSLAHFSDLHYCNLDDLRLHELLNKRLFGYLKWRLIRHAGYKDEIMAVLRRALKNDRPDHIVITGDLTHLSRSEEFGRIAKWLQSLAPSRQVTVIPGNHDMYVKTDWETTFARWADFMASDEKSPRTSAADAAFPILQIRGPIAIIGVCTAQPVNPLLAVGTAGDAQLHRLEQILRATGRRQLLRVVLIHHPPVAGLVAWRKRLTDADRFRAVVKRCGAELILHGHAHRSGQRRLAGPAREIPVIGIPAVCASDRKIQRRARYHIYRFSRQAAGWELYMKVRVYSPENSRFVPESEEYLGFFETL